MSEAHHSGATLNLLKEQYSDMIEEFNVDSKAEYDQFNVAHAAKNKKYKKETKTNNSALLPTIMLNP